MACLAARLGCRGGERFLFVCPRGVHGVDVVPGVGVEERDRVFAAVLGEVAVVAVDHRQAGAQVAGEVEGGDAGAQATGPHACCRRSSDI